MPYSLRYFVQRFPLDYVRHVQNKLNEDIKQNSVSRQLFSVILSINFLTKTIRYTLTIWR